MMVTAAVRSDGAQLLLKVGLGAVLSGTLSVPPKNSSYLVDPASSHMLVSKIKPCMCK